MKTYYHVTTENTIHDILQYGLIPKIGKLAQSCNETKERIYLFADKNSLENAINNWLIDSLEEIYGDNITIYILEITLPDSFPIYNNKNIAYEVYAHDRISPSFIKILQTI